MIQYLLIFFIPFLMTNVNKSSLELKSILYFFFYLYLVFFVGLRFEMGLDWQNYIKEFNDRNYIFESQFKNYFLNFLSFKFESLRNLEPFYLATLFLSNYFTGNIIFFNFINALISIGGVFYFCSKQKDKWFAISISTVFILLYGMDIVRQFTSLGISMVGIIKLSEKKYLTSLFFFIIAFLFHTAAIIFAFLFFYIIYKKLNLLYKVISIFVSFIIFIYLINFFYFTLNFADILDKAYVSKGMIFRLGINVVPLLIFFIFKNKYKKTNHFTILQWYSIILILIILLNLINFSPIFLDRLLIFTIPFQILIYCDFIKFFNRKKFVTRGKLLITTFYLIFSVAWLFGSEDNSRVYIPYKNILLEDFNSSAHSNCNLFYKCKLEPESNIKYE